ncbi:homeobox protein Hox-B3-like [Amphibalanus amphitrite]|uniref:homeobox protein Hox-B3-like n=1 Tax=Amphibalanus amphitrite TaxID=1232801 RepID=UPI001C91F6C3|nr:homeobox protein Hox-B3-like [Amphibalanus amphitrite]
MFEDGGALQSIEAMCKDIDSGVEMDSPRLVTPPPVSPAVSDSAEPSAATRRLSGDDSGSGSDSGSAAGGGGGGSAARRPARTVFSAGQMAALETEYAANRYLSTPQRRQLSQRLGLAEATVKVWFQNRRMKEKRQQSESQMHYLSHVMQSYMYQLQCAGVVTPLQPVPLPAATAPAPAPAVRRPVTSPVDLCRPRVRPHGDLFRPYAL